MKTKKIFLCYSNGVMKQKKETKITYDDIINCDYFMIPINAMNDCYTLIKPSKYLKFTNGIVSYRLCRIYTDYNDYNKCSYEPVYEVTTTVTSICDLIGLVNSIDKITIANYILSEDYDYLFNIGIMKMKIILFDNKKVIYDEEYNIENDVIMAEFDPYRITKIFRKIYDGTICGSIMLNDKYFIVTQKQNCLKWSISELYKSSGLIGVPLTSSNTLVFCTFYQVDVLCKFDALEIYVCVYYEKNKFIGEVSELIVNGENHYTIEKKLSDACDVFMDSHQLDRFSYGRPWTRFLEVITHSFFTFILIHSTYNILYGNIVNENTDENDDTISYNNNLFDFDVVVTLKLRDSSKKGKPVFHYKELTINRYSLLNLNDILENL